VFGRAGKWPDRGELPGVSRRSWYPRLVYRFAVPWFTGTPAKRLTNTHDDEDPISPLRPYETCSTTRLRNANQASSPVTMPFFSKIKANRQGPQGPSLIASWAAAELRGRRCRTSVGS